VEHPPCSMTIQTNSLVLKTFVTMMGRRNLALTFHIGVELDE